MATRGRLAKFGIEIAVALNAAPFAGMTQTEVHPASNIKGLRCQSGVTACIEAKGLFGAVSNRVAARGAALVIRIASFDVRLQPAQAYDGTIIDRGSAPGVDG
jgi:hypothetical protein